VFRETSNTEKSLSTLPPDASQNGSWLGIQDMKLGEKLATLDLRTPLTGHFLQIIRVYFIFMVPCIIIYSMK
jgi:cell wall assembly regulator SMI1